MTEHSSIDPEGLETYRSNVLQIDPDDPAEMLAYRRKFFSLATHELFAEESESWYARYDQWFGEITAIGEAIAGLDPGIATKALDRLDELVAETEDTPSLTLAVYKFRSLQSFRSRWQKEFSRPVTMNSGLENS